MLWNNHNLKPDNFNRVLPEPWEMVRAAGVEPTTIALITEHRDRRISHVNN
jgi:hypothetical protein